MAETPTISIPGLTLTRSLPVDLSQGHLVEVLARAAFLAPVPRERLEELAQQAPVRRYAAGEDIVRQGEYGHSMFVLVRGSVAVTAVDDQGAHIELATLTEPATYFGEFAMLGRRRRSATVRAVTPAILIELEKTRVERLDMVTDGVVMAALEVLSEQRAIRRFVENHRFLADMGAEGIEHLVHAARMHVYERGRAVFRQGDPADRVFLVKSGVAKLTRRREDRESVLAYFNVGDVIGLATSHQHTADLVSMGYLELIETPRREFETLHRFYGDLLDRFQKDVVDRGPEDLSKTSLGFVHSLVTEGAQEGLSLLTINLNTCIRCGNCVRACQARHGHARVTRRGKKLVRRVEESRTREHETVLIPGSCRHCVNPECMVGCPTGAVHRLPSGEVVIEEYCIGCTSCAQRCPYDNITMVPTPGRLVDGVERAQIANKCNLCAGYGEANCVHNCPTGAILRIEPTSYYAELRKLLGATGQRAVGDTHAQKRRELSKVLAPLIVALVGVGFGWLWWQAPRPYSPWSTAGMMLGGGALAAMLGAVMLAARRRLNRFPGKPPAQGGVARRLLPTQLGSFLVWARVHVYLGLLALVLVALHSNGRPGGTLTATLVALTLAEVITGLFGVGFAKWMPRTITRIEGDAQVEEDVRKARGQVRERVAELLVGLPEDARPVARALPKQAGALAARFGARYDHDARVVAARGWLKARAEAFGPDTQRALERLAADHVRLVDYAACLWLYGVRRTWLGLHVGISAALLALVVAHVITVLAFLGGAG